MLAVQPIRFLAVVSLSLTMFVGSPATAAPAGTGLGTSTAPVASSPTGGWEEILDHLLRALEEMVNTPPTYPVATRALMVELSSDYWLNGVPQDGDLGALRSLVEDVYADTLSTFPIFELDLRAAFLLDLTLIYTDLGGNPLDLLGL